MEQFCKIIDSEKFGQFLLEKTTSDDDYPCLKMTFLIGEIKASPEFKYTDEDESEAWAKVDEIFDGLELERCEAIASEIAGVWP